MDSWSFLGFNPTFFVRYSALKNYFASHEISYGNLLFFVEEIKEILFYAVNKHIIVVTTKSHL